MVGLSNNAGGVSVDTAALDRAKYIRLTTYRRDGRAVTCPVWLARLDDAYVFTTDATSGKVKRLANDQRVEVSPSDARGRVAMGATVYVGTGRLLSGDDVERVRAAISEKYGVLGKLIVVVGTLVAKLRRKPVGERAAVELRINGTR
jgi:PPOX class probable F420-dependent enzyme